MTLKKTKKGKHKPDWPQMFADRIIDLENRVAALEREQAAAVPVPADVTLPKKEKK